MRILAAPRDENDILDEERARLSSWTRLNDWSYLEYADAFELLSRIAELQAAVALDIAEIEVVAHGNPAICDDLSLGNADVVGESLRRIRGVKESTAVYLSGCNTGLEFNGECIARSLAEAFEAPIFGALGYLTGTHAERSERCVAASEFDGILYHSYPGGIDASGDHVWRQFGPQGHSTDGGRMQIKIATSGFRAVNLAGNEASNLQSALEEVLRTPASPSARMRMAPDLTFAIRLGDGEHVFELLAGGTVLRDPVTRSVWQFEAGQAILQSLLPYRKLPAA